MGYYCGIDLGNNSTSVCIVDGRRQVVERAEISTQHCDIKRTFMKYRSLTCLIEAGPLAEWFCKEVESLERGHKITIVDPRKAKAALSNRGKKTDKRDAQGLAELCRSGWYEAVHRKGGEARDMRSYMTARKQLVECSNALAASIRGILRAHGIRLSVRSDDSSFNEQVLEAISSLSPLVRGAIEELLTSHQQLHEKQRLMYRALNKRLKTDPTAKRLMTVPGVGPATAAAFMSTVDDPERFADGERLASYLGLVPSVYQSGGTEYHGRITKTGDKLLRWLLVEAAHIIMSRSNTPWELREWGLRLQERKGTGKARVAVARRLCGILLAIWKSGEVFHAESLQAVA